MESYQKPQRWFDASNKIFRYQVGFTAPPHDFDAAPSDFLRMSPAEVGVHGRMLHVPNYAHQLSQRRDHFHLLEDFVHCMANNGADALGQVGTNWVHASGTNPQDIKQFCERMSDSYQTAFHMAGYCLVEALQAFNITGIALNSVYYWPDWRDGISRFLRQAGFDMHYAGNFVDQGFYSSQEEVNALTWIFPYELFRESMYFVAEQAPEAEAIVVNGMPNFRRHDNVTQRPLHLVRDIEAEIGKIIICSDTALYWRIYKSLGIAPIGNYGKLLESL